jgi:hypothetical protein
MLQSRNWRPLIFVKNGGRGIAEVKNGGGIGEQKTA